MLSGPEQRRPSPLRLERRTESRKSPMSLLQVFDVVVAFGGNRAVDGLSLEVAPGTIVGLIGPNGAGKTTSIDAITGFVPSSGAVIFNGHSLSKAKSHERARRGMARTWQGGDLFEDLSVRDNLEVARRAPRWTDLFNAFFRPSKGQDDAAVEDTLRRLDLLEHADAMPDSLSHGQVKLVGVARALVSRPQLLLMDEPAAGLDETETAQLAATLRTLTEDGTAIFLVDHDMTLVMGVCDYIYVVDFGKPIAEGTPAEIRQNPAVIAAYLGTEADDGDLALTLEPSVAPAEGVLS